MKKRCNDVYYWTYGDENKPTIVMVHGFTGSHEGFQYIIPKLEKSFHIIVPDLPGFGESPLFSKPWTVDELARQTNNFVRTLKLKEKPFLVSHSLGGLVAASMLSQNPELFDQKTVFISPVATRIRLLDSRWIGSALGKLHYGVGKKTGKFGDKLVRSRRISRLATNAIMTEKDPAMQKTIHGHHFKNLDYISSIDFYHQLHKDITRQGVLDFVDSLQSFNTLIIAGDKDNVTPLKGEKLLAQRLQARLEIIPDVGHLAHYERSDVLASALVDFLG